MGLSGFFGIGLWVFLTAHWFIFVPVAVVVTGTILYIMFWRESPRGERADARKHNKRLAKRLDKHEKKHGREQPTLHYERFNLHPGTINPPPPEQTDQSDPGRPAVPAQQPPQAAPVASGPTDPPPWTR